MTEEANEVDAILKIVLLGDYNVGKTSTTLRFTTDKFEVRTTPTVGVDFYAKTVSVTVRAGLNMVNTRVRAQIWDTAGQEKYRSQNKTLFRGAAGVIFVYDITSSKSFAGVADWLAQVTELEEDPELMLIGNKSDLGHDREVETEDAATFAKEHGMAFLETSAKSGDNVAKAFQEIVETCVKELEIKPAWGKEAAPQKPKASVTTGEEKAEPVDEGRPSPNARKLPNQGIVLKEESPPATVTEPKKKGCAC